MGKDHTIKKSVCTNNPRRPKVAGIANDGGYKDNAVFSVGGTDPLMTLDLELNPMKHCL
jgi:hypothetical protein